MDPKQVRKTVDVLLADLARNPALGRPLSFMRRMGRPLGLGLALGVGSVAGCDSETSTPPRDSGIGVATDTRDALSKGMEIYGIDVSLPSLDTRDALPASADIYGATVDGLAISDASQEVLPAPVDAYGDDRAEVSAPLDGEPVDTRDALPRPVDIYGATVDGLIAPVDTRDAVPPSGDIYGAVIPPWGADGGSKG